MTTVAIHQPSYLVWPPLLEKMARADVFVFLDDVQYTRTSEIHRNRILSPQGPMWLSIPVGAGVREPIREVRLKDPSWGPKHWKTLRHCYSRAPFFRGPARDSLEQLYARRWTQLLSVNVAFTEWLRASVGVRTPLVFSSELGVTSCSSRRILDICRALGATRYLSGSGALGYMKLEEFEAAGVEVLVQDYAHEPYPQQFSRERFEPRLSAVDMLFNLGPETYGEILRRGHWKPAWAAAA